MENLGQERAKFAYAKVRKAIKDLQKGESETRKLTKEFSSFVAGLPAMILQNGLGHTLCFLLAKAADQKNNCYKKEGKEAKHWLAFDALAEWLNKRGMIAYHPDQPTEIVEELTKKNALDYLALQEEALRFLEWFKVMTKMFVEENKDAA